MTYEPSGEKSCIIHVSSPKSHSSRRHKSNTKGIWHFENTFRSNRPSTHDGATIPTPFTTSKNQSMLYSSQGSISSELRQSSTVLKYIWMQVHYASNMSGVNHAPFLSILEPKYLKRKSRKEKKKKNKERRTGAFLGRKSMSLGLDS